MFCNNCGTPLEEGELFCSKCGTKCETAGQTVSEKPAVAAEQATPVVQPMQAVPAEQVPEKKNPSNIKKLIFIIGIVAVLVIAVILVFSLAGSGSGKYDKIAKNEIEFANFDGLSVLFNVEGKTEELDDQFSNMYYSADNSVIAYTLDEGSTYSLYYATADDMKPEFVADDVNYFEISYDGAYIAYIQDLNDEWTAGDLYLYSIKDGKETKIDEDVYPRSFVLSPNGKYISYLTNYEGYSDNELYIAGLKKDPAKIDKDGSYTIGVTNDGKAYYVTDNEKLYYYNGKSSVKLASDVYSDYYFNNDLSELIYTKGDKLYYYTPKMKEPTKIASTRLYDIIVPDDMAYKYFGDTVILGKETLKNSILSTGNGLYWFDDKGKETHRIVSYYSDCMVSSDGETIIFTRDGKLYRVSGFGGNIEPEVLYKDEYVDGIVANIDLSKIYVVVEDEELYYVKNAKKSERITNDLNDGIYSVVYSSSMDKVVFLENDAVCYAGTTEKSKVMVEEEANYLTGKNNFVIYEIYDEDEDECTYYLLNGKEPIELFTY